MKVWMYLSYLLIAVGLTIWVGRTLAKNGLVFLQDVFHDERLAGAVNHLLVVGFYLVNLGFVAVLLSSDADPATTAEAVETLSFKIGLVLLVLGALHFFNLIALNRYRRTRLRQQAYRPPLPPQARLRPGAAPVPQHVGGGPVPPPA
jgi:protein-S-isoprenylcysteine O-methyltransferase Ste14